VTSPGHGCELLLVAAFPPELEGLDRGLANQRSADGGADWEIRGARVASRVVGVGMVAAAAGTARWIDALGPRVVVLTGTCGAYAGGSLAINDVVVGGSILLVEPAVEEGRAALPSVIPRLMSSEPGLRAALVSSSAGERRPRLVDVATTLGVTTDDELAASLARTTHAAVEHLEAYGVAVACEAQAIPFAVALGVANRVGAGGRAGWLAGHHAATAAVNRMLGQWIEDGAAGAIH
jgi:nucleoside phosphorylase